jgi:hypothetical protein
MTTITLAEFAGVFGALLLGAALMIGLALWYDHKKKHKG